MLMSGWLFAASALPGKDRSAAVRYSIPGPIGPLVIIEFRRYGRHHGLPFCVCSSLSLGLSRSPWLCRACQ